MPSPHPQAQGLFRRVMLWPGFVSIAVATLPLYILATGIVALKEERAPYSVRLGVFAIGAVVSLFFVVVVGTSLVVARRSRREADGLLRALQQTEKNYRELFDRVDDLLFILDGQGRIIQVNETVERRLGYSATELLGRPVIEVHPEGRRDEAQRIVGEMLSGSTATCPVPVQTKTGALVPVETRVVRGEWNGAPALIGITRDLSELKRSEEMFSKVFRSVPSFMALSRLDTGEYLEVNDAFLEGTGYTRAQVVGHTSGSLNLFAEPREREAARDALARDKRLKAFPARVRRADGELRHGLFWAELVELQSETLALTMMVDVTEATRLQRELETARAAAESANHAKSSFLAMMSHEIRTPLNGVLGMAEVLETTLKDDPSREALGVIRRAGENLQRVLNDVLDFSKIEAQQLELHHVPFSPEEAVNEVAELLRPRSKHVEFMVLTAPGVPAVVSGDAGRFRQVLTNLVANALKFTERGRVAIGLRPLHAEQDQVTLEVSVSDTGIGISEEGRARLFRVFSQAEGGRRFGGTGLGLAVSKRLVELMGGSIAVESALGHGSTFAFTLTLPVVSRVHSVPTPPPQPERLSGRVLMAEDNPVNQAVGRRMLDLLGLEVEIAPDGRAAVERYKGGGIDLVLMDMEMPELDGPGAAKEIRALPDLPQAPIIALTANALPGDRRRCLDAGMNDFLAKPYRLDQLRDFMVRWLPTKASQRAPLGH